MAATPQSIHILHVDDEPDLAGTAAEHLTRLDERFSIDVASSAGEALDRLDRNGYDCIVSDYDMPGLDGIQFLRAVREDYPDLPFILFTGKGSEEVAAEAISAGVSNYLQKEPGADQYAMLANRITNLVSQRRAERNLVRESHRFRKLFENTNDAVAWIGYNEEPPITEDHTPIIREANPAFREMFEPPGDDVVGRPLDEVVAAEDRREEAEAVSQQVMAGTQRSAELTRDTVDGPRTFLWRAVLIDDPEDGEVQNSFAVYTDISERKERERQLEAEQERFRTLFDHLTQPTIEVEYDGLEPIVKEVNPAFEEAFGYDESTLIGESIDDHIVPDERTDEAADINRRVREGGRLDSEEVTRMTADGPREFLLQNAVYEDGSGGFAVYMDITDRKKREAALEQYETLVEVAGDPMYMLDAAGEIEYLNEKFVELSGYSEHELLGEHVGKVMDEEDLARAEDLIRSLLSSGERRGTFEMEAVTADGDRIPAESHITLLFEDGEFNGSVGVMRVITERLERQRRLKRERDRFEEFANVLSHDLRNPLSVAAGRLEQLKEDCESEHLETIDRAHHRMESLIEDMLTLANAGRMIAETEPVELASLAESCWRAVETPSAELLVQTDLVLEADKSRLRQLMENLVRNSVEHSQGPVKITIGDLPSGFYIEDDGPGIPEDQWKTVLEPGYSTSESGRGFGLSIVRDIAEAHDWEINVTEGSSGGARFEFTTT